MAAKGGAMSTGSAEALRPYCQRYRLLHSNNVGIGGEGLM